MKVEVLRLSRWVHPGLFPTFVKGESVRVIGPEDTDFLGWYPCMIQGRETYIPNVFLTDGKLNRDYNPTELRFSVGDVLTVKEIVGGWVLAEDKSGQIGWVAVECVKSI